MDKPTVRSHSKEQPATLDYARYAGEYPQPRFHSRLVVLLVLAAALVGVWSIIVGALCLGDAWGFGLPLIAAGACLGWATIGKLSAASCRPKAALFLILPSITMYLLVAIAAQQRYVRQKSLYAAELQARQSDFRHLPTEAESRVFTYAMLRDNALAGMALGGICAVYAATRLIARKAD